jgi:hypothetical protein
VEPAQKNGKEKGGKRKGKRKGKEGERKKKRREGIEKKKSQIQTDAEAIDFSYTFLT